jgi:hypothetical protein
MPNLGHVWGKSCNFILSFVKSCKCSMDSSRVYGFKQSILYIMLLICYSKKIMSIPFQKISTSFISPFHVHKHEKGTFSFSICAFSCPYYLIK